MTTLTLLHTAQVHCATFDQMAPEADLHHIVRPDWLARAQTGIDASLQAEIREAVSSANGPVLCTCTTLGETAESAGAIRVDWPMMQQAARHGGPVVLAYCLDSTIAPSRALLHRAFAGQDAQVSLLDLCHLWPLFESGQIQSFHHEIATAIENAVHSRSNGCVVLAQLSMAPAADLAEGTSGIPVLGSAKPAIEALVSGTG